MDGAPEQDRLEWGGLPSPAILRAGIGLLLGAIASILAAFILGEYQFDGWMPLAAGILVGLVVAEIVLEVGRRRGLVIAAVVGLEAAGGLVWAGWISGGEGLGPIPGGAWLAAGLAAVTAVVRTYDWRRRAPSPAPDQSAGPS